MQVEFHQKLINTIILYLFLIANILKLVKKCQLNKIV